MKIDERRLQNVILLQLSGRIMLTDGTDLMRDTLQRLIDEGRTNVLLDLRDVPYIDSTAMAVLIRTLTTLRRQAGALKLLHVSGHVRELLTVTTLSSVFEIFDSEAEAVASFSTTAQQ